MYTSIEISRELIKQICDIPGSVPDKSSVQATHVIYFPALFKPNILIYCKHGIRYSEYYIQNYSSVLLGHWPHFPSSSAMLHNTREAGDECLWIEVTPSKYYLKVAWTLITVSFRHAKKSSWTLTRSFIHLFKYLVVWLVFYFRKTSDPKNFMSNYMANTWL